MLNVVAVMGRLGAAPELKKTENGISVVSFRIACDRNYASNGQRQTDWINVTAWRQQAEFICKHFGKGDSIVINGHLETRTWQTTDGQSRSATEVVVEQVNFAGGKQTQPQQETTWNPVVTAQQEPSVGDDEDIPF